VPGDALKILLHASQGLAAAHAQGVIHRDIKPGNIMITSRGQVKVADFGIALANQDVSAKLTNTGAFVGTPGYLSPEVCLGKMVDQRSDIFALGIVLFEMLSGRMPFHDDSPLKLMLDVVQADTPDIRELNPDVDEEIARILNKMLAKDPADRYQSCEDLNNDLKKHPLVIQDGQLKLRPAPWAGANASNPTVVGAPTPLTPGSPPRVASAPPVVSSRGPALSGQQPITGRITAEVAAPAAARSNAVRNGLVLAGVLMLGAAGWMVFGKGFGLGKPAEAPTVAAAAATVTPPAAGATTPPVPPATPTAIDAATGLPADATADAATGSDADAALADAAIATPYVHYGHGGPNQDGRNRVRVRAAKEPSPEDIAREAARRQNEEAARLALEQQAAAVPEQVAPVAEVDPDAAAKAKAKRSFMCRVFKKCDPPTRKTNRNQRQGSNPPETTNTP